VHSIVGRQLQVDSSSTSVGGPFDVGHLLGIQDSHAVGLANEARWRREGPVSLGVGDVLLLTPVVEVVGVAATLVAAAVVDGPSGLAAVE
jgi:hypothetical protein